MSCTEKVCGLMGASNTVLSQSSSDIDPDTATSFITFTETVTNIHGPLQECPSVTPPYAPPPAITDCPQLRPSPAKSPSVFSPLATYNCAELSVHILLGTLCSQAF